MGFRDFYSLLNIAGAVKSGRMEQKRRVALVAVFEGACRILGVGKLREMDHLNVKVVNRQTILKWI